jgi:hypothetical protein
MVTDETAESGQERPGTSEPAAPGEPTLGYVAPLGTKVRAADGECLGHVIATWPSYVFVETTPGTDAGYWVPVEAFAGAEDAALVLSVTRDEAARRGWTELPPVGPAEHR